MRYDLSHRMPPRQGHGRRRPRPRAWPSNRATASRTTSGTGRGGDSLPTQQAVARQPTRRQDDFDGNGYGGPADGYPGGSVGDADTNDGYAGPRRLCQGWRWLTPAATPHTLTAAATTAAAGRLRRGAGSSDAEAPGGTRGRT